MLIDTMEQVSRPELCPKPCDGVTLAALPLLAASLTRDPTEVSLVSLAVTLPWLLFALVGGALADRLDRRKAMAAVDGVRMVLIGALGVVVLTDQQSLWLLVVIAFLLGTAETVFDPRLGFDAPGWVIALLPAAWLAPKTPERRALLVGGVVAWALWAWFVPVVRFGLGIWAWAWLPHHKRKFDDLAKLPMEDAE